LKLSACLYVGVWEIFIKKSSSSSSSSGELFRLGSLELVFFAAFNAVII